MMKFTVLFCTMLVISAGCKAPETLAKGVSEKSVSGSGAFAYNRAGLNTSTQTPELFSLFVWGDYTSVIPGSEIFRMEEEEDSSIFNSQATNKKRKIFFASQDKERMDKVIGQLTKKGEEDASKSN